MTLDISPKAIKDIVIIGGGITGLACAFYLQKLSQEKKRTISFSLLEASQNVGGKIATDIVESGLGSFLLEHGPDSFLVQKPWALELAIDLGMQSELLETNDEHRRVFVYKKSRLIAMPDGTQLMVPTRFWPFATTPLFSPFAKLRAAMEPFVARRTDDNDESVAHFVRRRLGQEVLDYLAEPLLAGIYNSDPSKQSLLATFPQFAVIERKYGSLIRGMLASKRQPTNSPKKEIKSAFASFKTGMTTLPSALQKQLTEVIHTKAKVNSIRKTGDNCFALSLDNGQEYLTRSALLTMSAAHSARLLDSLAPDAAVRLKSLRTNSSGSIYFAFKKSDIKHALHGFGVVIPEREKRAINAITWTSSKLSLRAPENAVLLRVFFGGSKNPQTMDEDDTRVEQIARDELKAIMGIDATPLFYRIYRGQNVNPQYDVGHLSVIEKIENSLPPGIWLAGSAYRGVGIPDCVLQGRMAAEKLFAAATASC